VRSPLRFFEDEDMEFMVQILLGGAYFRVADPGEVFATCEQIKSGDYESWCSEWETTAERALRSAEESREGGHRASAREAYLRASTYFFQSVFFVEGTDQPDRIGGLWRRHRDCYERAAELFDPPFEKVAIPYEDTELEGWFFPPVPHVAESRFASKPPVLLLCNGSDGTVTDMWAQGAAAATERGWAALTFDGPGQGQALFEQELRFRPDWEAVVTPVVDHVLGHEDVDHERIAIQGVSQGGYWVPRAVAFEHRIAAAVADPGVVDVSAAMLEHTPKSQRKLIDEGKWDKLERQDALAERFSKSMRWMMKFRALPYGGSVADLYRGAMEHRLDEETIGRIRCPVLVTDPEDEQFWPGQSQRLYDALDAPGSEIVRFTAEEGAELHCEPRSPAIRAQRIFDWLERTLGVDG
jgi:alpha-beta hydrolase superfamily lysophospholipase